MLSIPSLLVTLTAAVGALAAPLTEVAKRDPGAGLDTRSVAPGTGTSNGYYYSFYNAGGGTVTYNNDAAGAYDVEWTNCNVSHPLRTYSCDASQIHIVI